MSLLKASLVASWLSKNNIFDLDSALNRDATFAPYVQLRNVFLRYGIELNTPDVNHNASVLFEIHQDVSKLRSKVPAYLLRLETDFVQPLNASPGLLSKYRKIFTWNDLLVDGKNVIKINFPNPIEIYPDDDFLARDRFCCLISSNRTLNVQDDRILYPERVKAIRWFEAHAPKDFDLYGVGWNTPVVSGSLIGKIERRFWRVLDRLFKQSPFPSYRGKVQSKRDVLTRTKFAICYENVRDLPGYITEKIFDCFFSGCIPVYWGASNISEYIPADCFIDRRQFQDTEAVYRHLKSITEQEFTAYQQRIRNFLSSDAAKIFGSEFFAETIVNVILKDLENK